MSAAVTPTSKKIGFPIEDPYSISSAPTDDGYEDITFTPRLHQLYTSPTNLAQQNITSSPTSQPASGINKSPTANPTKNLEQVIAVSQGMLPNPQVQPNPSPYEPPQLRHQPSLELMPASQGGNLALNIQSPPPPQNSNRLSFKDCLIRLIICCCCVKKKGE
jgi:hypothetical protein